MIFIEPSSVSHLGGLTPFLFTSEKELASTRTVGGVGEGNWYMMWVNPRSVNIQFKPNNSDHLTQQDNEFFHWHNALPVLTFTGVSGWLFSRQESKTAGTIVGNFIDSLASGRGIRRENITDPVISQAFPSGIAGDLSKTYASGIDTPRTVQQNNAPLFFSRLQKVATQEKFFFDSQKGYERYNARKIRIYTKAYPEGKELVGFFTSFEQNEENEDTQLLHYSCSFIAQKGLEVQEIEELTTLEKFQSKSFLGLTEQKVESKLSSIEEKAIERKLARQK